MECEQKCCVTFSQRELKEDIHLLCSLSSFAEATLEATHNDGEVVFWRDSEWLSYYLEESCPCVPPPRSFCSEFWVREKETFKLLLCWITEI